MGTANSVGESSSGNLDSSDAYWQGVNQLPSYSASSAAQPSHFGHQYAANQSPYAAAGSAMGHTPYVSPEQQYKSLDAQARGCPSSAEPPFRVSASPGGSFVSRETLPRQTRGLHVGREGLAERQVQSSSFHVRGHEAVTDQYFHPQPSSFAAQVDHSQFHTASFHAGIQAASPARPDTLLIFDWDDTLMCSSAINANQFPPHQYAQLEGLVEQVLTQSMRLGETCIVTNADELWVLESTRRFLPRVMPLLGQMAVMSARKKYEHACPGDVFAWKRETFREVLAARQHTAMASGGTNLVVLGDSLAEMEAAHTSTVGLLPPSAVKTVKFKETPSVDELMEQLRMLSQELASIVADEKSGCRHLAQSMRPCAGLQIPGASSYVLPGAATYGTLPVHSASASGALSAHLTAQLQANLPPAAYATFSPAIQTRN